MTTGHSHNNEELDIKNSKLLLWSFLITISFMIIEAIGGIINGSLTLIADAGHMFADAFSILLSWFAIRISKKPKDTLRTFGYHRFQVIATFINGISLLGLTIWIIYEALYRMFTPSPVDAYTLFYIGVMGVIVNFISFIILRQGSHEDMNIKSAIIHVLSDVLGSIAAVIAGIIIIFTDKEIADPILSLIVSLLLLNATFRLIRDSGHILMEGAPKGLDIDSIIEEVKKHFPEIKDIHHVHIWSIKAGKSYVTFHLNMPEKHNSANILKKVKTLLHDKFSIEHSTIQIENTACLDKDC